MSVSPRTVRGNRLGLAVTGVVVLAAGAVVVARATGLIGPRAAALITPTETADVHARDWAWWVLAGLAAVIVVLAARWLLVQLRTGDLGAVQLEADRSRGETRLVAAALVDAVEAEVGAYPGVVRASADLTGSAALPQLRLVVTVDGSTDLAEVRRRIHDEAVAHVRQAVDASAVPLRLEIAVR